LARDLSGEGIGPAIRSGLLAAAAVEAHLRRGTALGTYGSGEEGWLGRQLGRLPEALARGLVRTVLGMGLTRRRVVFGAIFGMREVPA